MHRETHGCTESRRVVIFRQINSARFIFLAANLSSILIVGIGRLWRLEGPNINGSRALIYVHFWGFLVGSMGALGRGKRREVSTYRVKSVYVTGYNQRTKEGKGIPCEEKRVL